MRYSENAINILTAKTFKGIGRAWIVKNLKGNEAVETLVALLDRDAKETHGITLEDFERCRGTIKQKIQKLQGFIDGIVAVGDSDFPRHRGEVKKSEQPVVLFYRGRLELLGATNKNIAVIGLLKPDTNIESVERQVVSELVRNGATIISGLALGCDTIAHEQTLELNGQTVAILPSPLSNILPATNKELADRIVMGGGVLISEYIDDAKSKLELGGRYQERDRLQALFSDCIVLSASYAKNDQGNDSGSRLAMGYALDYSIPRAVIYDSVVDVNNPKFDLSRQSLNEDNGTMVINRANIAEVIKKIILIEPGMKNDRQSTLFYG